VLRTIRRVTEAIGRFVEVLMSSPLATFRREHLRAWRLWRKVQPCAGPKRGCHLLASLPLQLAHQLSGLLGFQYVDGLEQESVLCYYWSYSTIHWTHRSCAPTIIYRCTTSMWIHASLDPVRKRKACYGRTCWNRCSTPERRAWEYDFGY
jgi:hypothetical protein